MQVLRDSNRALKARLTVSSDNTSAGTAGIAYDVGTPAMSGFAQTSQQSHQATRALTNIFIRRTVGEKFVSEIRGANVRHDADVGSARQLHAALPKPWLNVTRPGNFTIAHNGELSAPIEAEVTMPSVAPVDVPVVSRDNNALHFPTPDDTRELVRSQILDTIFESTTNAGGNDAVLPGAMQTSDRTMSVQQPAEILVFGQTAADALSSNRTQHGVIRISDSSDLPFARSGAELSRQIEQRPSRAFDREGDTPEDITSTSPAHGDVASVNDIVVPASSVFEQDDRMSQYSSQERRVRTKARHKQHDTHHTAASDDGHVPSATPSFKPLSIHDRVSGAAGNERHPRRFLLLSPLTAEASRRSSVHSIVDVEPDNPDHASAHHPVPLFSESVRRFSTSLRPLDMSATQSCDPPGNQPKPQAPLPPPPVTAVADLCVPPSPSLPPPQASGAGAGAASIVVDVPSAVPSLGTTALPPAEAVVPTSDFWSLPHQIPNHFAIALDACTSSVMVLVAGCWNAFTVPSFSDKDLEDSAKRAVHQRMVGCASLELYFNRLSVSIMYFR